jgi:hypothetical protein
MSLGETSLGEPTSSRYFWMEICPKFEYKNLSEKFSAEIVPSAIIFTEIGIGKQKASGQYSIVHIVDRGDQGPML